MRLFEVKDGVRVRVISKSIRLEILTDLEVTVAEDVTWSGITTGTYLTFPTGVRRRLVLFERQIVYNERGVWCSDIECEEEVGHGDGT